MEDKDHNGNVTISPSYIRFYGITFLLAGLYNVAFGVWSIFWPEAFFNLFSMDPPLYPAVWRSLGLLVGLYGMAYIYAGIRLDRAWPFVAIGLAGKILGPIGWLITVNAGEWPLRTFWLIVFNDLIWWIPFGLFLLQGQYMDSVFKHGKH